ncbi:WRKY transcription factor-like protein [Medicago truncatula]|uniref:WRKY transcription factor-like protein n=2 Tax=Medicago truncatula TaxID=3880 RepID=A0A072TYP9_MEDTR|nr:WRKY transcription factor-like protein [Medicago truncatula]
MKDADVTENELKLISYELEKFLETEEESFNESSGRNSRLSLSNIKISGKQTDGSEDEDCGNKDVCPLQGYLLGSSFEIPEKVQVRKERASLAELFQRTKTANEDCIETGVKDTQVKQAHKSPMHIMKKMLKMVHISSKSCNTSENIADSTTTNKKLSKVLRKFHRKVHPEDTLNAKSVTKSHKDKIKNLPRECFDEHCEINWNPPQDDLCCSGSTGNNEHWIKTDAECKYYISLESNYSSTKI